MILLFRPREEFVQAAVNSGRRAELTYSQVGVTQRSQCPEGFTPNEWTAIIGNGEHAFESAKEAIKSYSMLQLSWLQRVGPLAPIAADSIVCTLARQFGVYSLNVAKIVYVEDESSNRFSFGYGTTAEYPLVGEERFTVSLNESTGDVSFEIFSFSRPNSLLMRLAWPWLRRAQRRFCRDATEAMRDALEKR